MEKPIGSGKYKSISLTLPEEPAIQSVVLDEDGIAWQHLIVDSPDYTHRWFPAQTVEVEVADGLGWDELLVSHPELLLIYTPLD